MANLPCFLCGKELDLRTDKNKKKYAICDPCGMQVFVRRAQGIENLERLIRALKRHSVPLRAHAHTLFQIRAILEELYGVEGELDKLDDSISIFSKTSKEKGRARKLIKQRMQTLLNDLERIAG
jgi:DNA-directed RNA polymerase subunit RPC12/RpoP